MILSRLMLAAAGLGLLLSGCGNETQAPAPKAAAEAESSGSRSVTVLYNAVLHTMHTPDFALEAIAFNDHGDILMVGGDEPLLGAFPQATSRDMGGLTIIPGLIDAHAHLHGLAESLTRAQLAGTGDPAEVLDRLRDHEATLGLDDWLLGRGWDQNDWPVQEFPSRQDLDAHFSGRPVWLRRIDGHAGWANTAALAMVDRDLAGDWQPEGGFIYRDADGEPTGILIDRAMDMLDAVVPPTSDEVLVQALDLAIGQMVSLGLTGVHDPGIDLEILGRYRRMIEAGRFNTRVYAMTDGAGATLDWLCENGALNHPSGRLLMRSTKLYADGALGSRGAALLADYGDDLGNTGLLILQPEEMQAQVSKVLGCGFQAAVHAIGDRGNRVVINALQAAMAEHPDNPGRHRVEHAQVLHADDVARFGQLDIIAAMQPTHATSDMYWAEERIGPDRIRHAYAWRSLRDSGAVLAFGSDFPVEEVNPMHGIYAAVARRDLEGWPQGGWYPGEAVSRREALEGFTIDAAYAAFMEDEVGSLAAGKRADFIVLDRDIMTVPAEDIPHIQVLETWLDGERVFVK